MDASRGEPSEVVWFGIGTLLVVEQPSLESRLSGVCFVHVQFGPSVGASLCVDVRSTMDIPSHDETAMIMLYLEVYFALIALIVFTLFCWCCTETLPRWRRVRFLGKPFHTWRR